MKEISVNSKVFPELLRTIDQPPQKLYVNGTIPERPVIAIVGTRKPTSYGEQVTYRLSYDLAKSGLVIASGLAYGIDAIAHRAAIDANGTTIAVLGSGITNIYPGRHKALAEDIVSSGGAILSEYPPDMPPMRHHFPARNRIISGLSLVTLVTEADAQSGSLITANLALGQNRLIAAVPGPITSLRSAGPNNLLKSGAVAITDAVDLLNLIDMDIPHQQTISVIGRSEIEQIVIDQLNNGTCQLDEMIESCDLAPEVIAQTLSLLEITGRAKSLGAGNWMLTGRN